MKKSNLKKETRKLLYKVILEFTNSINISDFQYDSDGFVQIRVKKVWSKDEYRRMLIALKEAGIELGRNPEFYVKGAFNTNGVQYFEVK